MEQLLMGTSVNLKVEARDKVESRLRARLVVPSYSTTGRANNRQYDRSC